jgi:hypothetical protein
MTQLKIQNHLLILSFLFILVANCESIYNLSSIFQINLEGNATLDLALIGLVPWGTIGSIGTTFNKYLGKKERASWTTSNVPSYLLGVIVGLVLSDGYLRCMKGRVNARLEFVQSIKNLPFFSYVFWLIAPICQSLPYITSSIRKGVFLSDVHIQTRALPFLTEVYLLFYGADGTKALPDAQILYNLLSPIALAIWIGGDGTWLKSGTILCTDSFTVQDTVKLMNILNVRYGLESTLFFHDARQNKYPRIYIKAKSMPILRSLVLPYLPSSMHYKLGL